MKIARMIGEAIVGTFWLPAVFFVLFLCLAGWMGRPGHGKYVLFSNDGPLGSNASEQTRPPGTALGVWQDLNWLGDQAPSHMGVSFGIRVLCFFPECKQWDESEWLGAIYGLLTLSFPLAIIGASVWRERKGLGPL